jgi:cytochrome c oxidase subunit 4
MVKPETIWRLCRTPVLTWLALVILLGATFGLAYAPMGSLNLPVSLGIAAVKALLVGIVFMRLSEDRPLNRLAAGVGPIWIFILLLLSGADYFTR